MKQETFRRLVAQALDELPKEFQDKLDNVDVIVEDWPDRETLRLSGLRHPAQLLGFYHGVPQVKRTQRYGLVLPDKISLYRKPILMRGRSTVQVRAVIERVLRHEIAHHFGLSDDRLRELGVY